MRGIKEHKVVFAMLVITFLAGLLLGNLWGKKIKAKESETDIQAEVSVSENVSKNNVVEPTEILKEEEPPKEAEEPIIEEKKEEPDKETNVVGTLEEGFYMNLSHYTLWESGEYSIQTGEKVENRRRMCYPKPFENQGLDYIFFVSENYSLNVCEYSADEQYLGYVVVNGEQEYQPAEETAYFTVTLFNSVEEKSFSPGQWSAHIGNDVKVILCTKEWVDYSVKDMGSLIEPFDTGKMSSSDMRELLLSGRDDELSDVLWKQQVSNGVYSINGSELDNKNVTYFVSSSEGDDRNSGLDINHPRKTVDYFSKFSNVNVLLKCGDTFDVSKEMSIGSNCIYAAYGKGPRPVLNFYRKLDVTFKKDSRCENLWAADLSGMDICDGSATKDNCNIGQLIIDGEINLRRCVWSSDDTFDPNRVVKNKDNAWAVDWVDSTLYMYSEEDPNNKDIRFAPSTNAMTITGSSNVVIKGLEIRGAGRHGINMTDVKNVSVTCCYINHIGGSVLRQAGVRYGNGIQVWNSGTNVTVEDNYLSWIFDTCFTHQGNDDESVVEHLHVNNNIGAHFFWGIEVWGSGYSKNEFKDVVYSNNILFDNIDVTNPTTPMHAGPNTRLQGVSEAECISYRNGYFYHQMSSFNVSDSGVGEMTKIENNIAWNSNRFLVLASDSKGEEYFSPLKNNILYAQVEEEKACMLRYQKDGVKNYCREMEYLDPSNDWSVHLSTEGYIPQKENKRVEELLTAFVNGR